MAWVFKRGQHWLILTDGLNQHMGNSGYRKQPYQHKDIFILGKQSNQHQGIFGECLSSSIILALHLLLEQH